MRAVACLVGFLPVLLSRIAAASDVSTPPAPLASDLSALAFARHDVDSGALAQVTQGFNVGDIDGDGRLDLVAGGDAFLVWYHNPDWTSQLIAAGYKFSAGAAVAVRDIDGDGRTDVFTGRYPFGVSSLRETVWYANTASGWVVHPVSQIAFCHDLAFADYDGDGRVDTACADIFRGELAWLQAPADPTAEWTTHTIDTRVIMGTAAADIDEDGRVDVVSGRAWYRNVDATAWPRYPFTTREDALDPRFNDFAKHSVLDLDGDGHLDVFATIFSNSREGEAWAFLRPSDPLHGTWAGVQVDPGPLFGVHSQAAASFDGSTRPQVMVGETNIGGYGFGANPSPEIYIYRLPGAPTDPAGWERILVDRRGTHEARAVDIGGDGFPDIAGDEENTELIAPLRNGRVTWWENTLVQTPDAPPAPPDGAPPSCSDDDPCTLDHPAPGGTCTHRPATGFAMVTCACARSEPSACEHRDVPRAVRRQRAHACRLVRQAASGRRSRKRLDIAVRILANASKQATRVERRNKLSGPCARAVYGDLDDLRRRAALVRGSLGPQGESSVDTRHGGP